MTHSNNRTPCECPVAGFCERHQCEKPPHWHKLCRTRPDYFALWEEGRGPGQHLLKEPGMLQKAVNYGIAVVRHLADRRRQVDNRIYEERLAICRTCPFCDRKRLTCREKTCGCRLKIKARWASERCPLGKWEADSEKPPDASTLNTDRDS